jgi:hypothetical protein
MPTDPLVEAAGNALAASLVQSSVLVLLVTKGLLSREEAISTVDAILLILERHQADASGAATGAIGDYARSRLESLIRQLQATPEPPG